MIEDVMNFFLMLPGWAQIACGILFVLLILAIVKKFIKFAILLAVLIVLAVVILKMVNIIFRQKTKNTDRYPD